MENTSWGCIGWPLHAAKSLSGRVGREIFRKRRTSPLLAVVRTVAVKAPAQGAAMAEADQLKAGFTMAQALHQPFLKKEKPATVLIAGFFALRLLFGGF